MQFSGVSRGKKLFFGWHFYSRGSKKQGWLTTATLDIFSSLWWIGGLTGELKKLFPESCNYEEMGIGKYELHQILK